MTVTAHVYTMAAQSLAQKLVDIDSDTLKVMLLSAYTPNQDTHQFKSDVLGAGTEAAGTGYTAGGATLGSVTWSRSGHVYTLDCADPSWANAITASHAVFYDSTPGSDATRPVLCYWALGGSVSLTGLTIHASGLLNITGT